MLEVIYGRHDFNLVSNRDAINLLFRKVSIAQIEKNITQYDVITKHTQNPQEVLDILRRNISNWKIIANHYNAKITYVLQPYANWLLNQQLTDNERRVFDMLDRKGGENWRILSSSINGLHEWYSNELTKVCEEQNINYCDSNDLLNDDSNNGVFVDRIHLTDFGNKKICISSSL